MKKVSMISLLFALFFTAGCTYTVRDFVYRPAAPLETRGASYAPVGKIKESIEYYRDFDIVGPVWHTSYYLMEGSAKMPLLETQYEYNRMYDIGTDFYAAMPAPYEYLLRQVLQNTGADTIMNLRFEDSCEVDWYYAIIWFMNDRQCKLTLTGTMGKIR